MKRFRRKEHPAMLQEQGGGYHGRTRGDGRPAMRGVYDGDWNLRREEGKHDTSLPGARLVREVRGVQA